MSNGIQKNDTQQYCTLEEASGKSLSDASFVQYSPTSTPSWWGKSENDSPKDGWSSDSESSQQTLYYGNGGDGNTENMLSTDSSFHLSSTTEEITGRKKKKCKDTPAVNKPAQVVERRNARERRRVQAVNGAFQKLRKVVPIEENKSKRMSKVKTLQLAIEYINQLQNQLQFTTNHTSDADLLADLFTDYQQQQPVKLEPNEFPFRVPTSYYLTDSEN